MTHSSGPRKTANLSDSVHQQLNMHAIAAGAVGVGMLRSFRLHFAFALLLMLTCAQFTIAQVQPVRAARSKDTWANSRPAAECSSLAGCRHSSSLFQHLQDAAQRRATCV
jgi:hypothetical protein